MHIGVQINIAIKPVTKDVAMQCDSGIQDVELQYDAKELPQCTRLLEHCPVHAQSMKKVLLYWLSHPQMLIIAHHKHCPHTHILLH